jgi:hypothetical protein
MTTPPRFGQGECRPSVGGCGHSAVVHGPTKADASIFPPIRRAEAAAIGYHSLKKRPGQSLPGFGKPRVI